MSQERLVEFEKSAAAFCAHAIKELPEALRPCVVAASLCARTPDVSILWHYRFRDKYPLRVYWRLSIDLMFALIKLPILFLVRLREYAHKLYGTVRDEILVVGSVCGREDVDGNFCNAYVRTTADDAQWLFGPKSLFDGGACLIGRKRRCEYGKYIGWLLWVGCSAYCASDASKRDRHFLLLEWVAWVFSLSWIFHLHFSEALHESIVKYQPRKVGCSHEMHAYARVVWYVAKKYSLQTSSVQHASFSSGKRWYYLYQDEISSGICPPDIMYVFNAEVARHFKSYYPQSNFPVACSPRYAHWKSEKAISCLGGNVLFAGALAFFDNIVLVRAIRSVVRKGVSGCIVRLHPKAIVKMSDRWWLKKMELKGIIKISKGVSLIDDIKRAKVVVGMSTTVLEEALLLGVPAVRLEASDYLSFIDIDGIEGARTVSADMLDRKLIDSLEHSKVDSYVMRSRFGLDLPEVTYETLFLSCN